MTEHVHFAILPIDMKEAAGKPREALKDNTGFTRGV